MFKRILIANRGEIALRVMRTAREMGIESVAVYSDRPRALHVAPGGSVAVAAASAGRCPSESYLDIDKILAAAQQTGAEAIHPGYGFLAENAVVRRGRVEEGGADLDRSARPSPIEARWATRSRARKVAMTKAPACRCVPGLMDRRPRGRRVAQAVGAAEEIGYPVALKAAAGGGGKGIRIVRAPESGLIEGAFRTASGRGRLAPFGDGRIYLEKLPRPGRATSRSRCCSTSTGGARRTMGERDCTTQRRHQKLVEEAALARWWTPELRERAWARSALVGRRRPWATSAPVRWSSSTRTPRARRSSSSWR